MSTHTLCRCTCCPWTALYPLQPESRFAYPPPCPLCAGPLERVGVVELPEDFREDEA